MQDEVAYATAKAGLCGFVRALAVDSGASGTIFYVTLRPKNWPGACCRCTLILSGITANCVAPGWIDTESLSEHERSQGCATPMRRCGTPHEIASCVQWLASESASYITGQTVMPRVAQKTSSSFLLHSASIALMMFQDCDGRWKQYC